MRKSHLSTKLQVSTHCLPNDNQGLIFHLEFFHTQIHNHSFRVDEEFFRSHNLDNADRKHSKRFVPTSHTQDYCTQTEHLDSSKMKFRFLQKQLIPEPYQ